MKCRPATLRHIVSLTMGVFVALGLMGFALTGDAHAYSRMYYGNGYSNYGNANTVRQTYYGRTTATQPRYGRSFQVGTPGAVHQPSGYYYNRSFYPNGLYVAPVPVQRRTTVIQNGGNTFTTVTESAPVLPYGANYGTPYGTYNTFGTPVAPCNQPSLQVNF